MKKGIFILIMAGCVLFYSISELKADRRDIVKTCEQIVSSLHEGTTRSDFEDNLNRFVDQINLYANKGQVNEVFLDYAFDFYKTSDSILTRLEERNKTYIYIKENNDQISMGFANEDPNSKDQEKTIQFSETKDSKSMKINSKSKNSLSPTHDLYRYACDLLNRMHLFIDIEKKR